jgi:iron complex outermembrane receptor protein
MYIYFRYIVFLLFSFSVASFSSAQIRIRGMIQSEDGSPIVSAVVALSKSATPHDVVTAASSNDQGKFDLSAAAGTYLLTITFLQDNLYQADIQTDQNIDLGTITLKKYRQPRQLAEVEVKKYKPTVTFKNGKLEFTPNIVETGSILEILKIAPTVQIQDDEINLVGKSGTEMRINGRKIHMSGEQLTAYLSSLSANTLEKLEIISNAGAEYDADARGGIINVVLKKAKEKGLNASSYITQSKSKYANTNIGGNFNMLTGKWQTWASLGLGKGKNWTYGTNDIFYSSGLWQDKNEQKTEMKNLSATGGIEYIADSSNVVNASFSYYRGPSTGMEVNRSFIYNTQNTLDSALLTTGTNPQTYRHLSSNLNYVHTFVKTNSKLTFDYAQVSTRFDREQDFTNTTLKAEHPSPAQRFYSGNNQNLTIQTANLALDIPNKLANLHIGAKIIFNNNQNATSFYQFLDSTWDASEDKFDNFEYKERIQALYAQGNRAFGKWNFQGGIRLENTQTQGKSLASAPVNKTRYTQLFPSFSASFDKDDNNTFNLSYGKKIQRPEFSWVNPFAWYTNAYEYSHGNPALQPYFSHDLTLMYILKQRWTFYANYYTAQDIYAEYMKIDTATGLRESRVDNFVNQDIWSLYAGTNLNLWSRWKISPQVSLLANRRGSSLDLITDTSGFQVNAQVHNQIQILSDNKLTLSLHSSYSSPGSAGVLETKSRFVQDAGITYQAVKDTLQVSINGSDLFKSGAFQYDAYVNNIRRTRYKYSSSQQVSMTIRYNFKKGKKREINRSNANDDELRRAG